jgi:hypothetical protein
VSHLYYFSIRIDSGTSVAGQNATIAILAYKKIENKIVFMLWVVAC